MSVYLAALLLKISIIGLAVVALIAGNAWFLLGAFGVVTFAMFWRRCYRCGLPAFWRRRKSDPDHFIYYLANLPSWPGRDCSRCGEDLTVERLV